MIEREETVGVSERERDRKHLSVSTHTFVCERERGRVELSSKRIYFLSRYLPYHSTKR